MSSTEHANHRSAPYQVEVTESFWNWKRGKIRYWETAPQPDKPTIFILHGFGASVEHWKKNIPVLATHGQVCAMDLLGFGQSDMPDVEYTTRLWQEQVSDFLVFRGMTDVFLIGHSLGGLVAAQFTHDCARHIQRLILVNPMGLPAPDASAFMYRMMSVTAKSRLIRRLTFMMMSSRNFVRRGLKHAYHDPSAVTEELVDLFSTPLARNGAINAYVMAHSPTDFTLTTPKGISVPTLIIWGESDRLLPAKHIHHFQVAIPSAQTTIIPRAGHCPYDEASQVFNTRVLEFFGAS